jgi:hypothetical protein
MIFLKKTRFLKKCIQNADLRVDQNFRTHMDANSTIINRFKMQCNKFSGNLAKGLSKIEQRLFKEMNDIYLSQILYFKIQYSALTPSLQFIFFPSL